MFSKLQLLPMYKQHYLTFSCVWLVAVLSTLKGVEECDMLRDGVVNSENK